MTVLPTRITDSRCANASKALVRDIWALRLQTLRSRISYESETDTEAPSSHVFSSQSESETDTASRFSRRNRKRKSGIQEGTPNLLESLSFCYVGILLLRIPVTVADLHMWINNGVLLYYRACREIPLGMREGMPGRYQELLEPQDLLRPESLHQTIRETLILLDSEFGMIVPALNVPLVLYRWVKDLALPIEVFAATQRLARALTMDIAFVFSGRASTSVVLRYPEAQLMALVLVATKLMFPFDDRERCPRSATDLSAFRLDWGVWTELQNSNHDSGQSHLTFEQAFVFNESDVLEAADDKLDAYLHWCEGNVASEEVREKGRAGRDADFRRTLFKMFPTDSDRPKGKHTASSSLENHKDKRTRQVQSMLVPKQVWEMSEAPEKVRRAGSLYLRFRTVEELSGQARQFFEMAAKLAGLSLESMIQAVFMMERKVQKHEEYIRKTTEVT